MVGLIWMPIDTFHGRCPSTHAGVKAPTAFLHGMDFALGSPPLTPDARLGRWNARAGSSRRLVEHYQPSLPYPMPNKQPSFIARVEQMHDAAVSLKSIAEIVAEE